MKQKFLWLCWLFTVCCCLRLTAAIYPEMSTAHREVWYLLQFQQGALVLNAHEDGTTCTAEFPLATPAQLWKFEGSWQRGFTLTNQLGQTLYYTGVQQGDTLKASCRPTRLKKFKFRVEGRRLSLTPLAQPQQSINAWGGLSQGHAIRFYASSDPNAALICQTAEEFARTAPLPLIPYPRHLQRGEGSYSWNDLHTYRVAHPLAQAAVQGFLKAVSLTTGKVLLPTATEEADLALLHDAQLPTDAYRLVVNAKGITITAGSYGGYFYALQTLQQLLPPAIYGTRCVDASAWHCPCVTIDDAPEVPYRGFMLDVGRHFYTVEQVKKLLKVAATYKLNRFHWHLTEDQGWRIEIPDYPKLTEIGSIRKGSLILNDPGHGQFYDPTEYGRGCYYTLDQIREVVAYAKTLNIEILPEIDLPGHMLGAIAAYPEFSCDPDAPHEVRIANGISDDVLNVGDDRVIAFLEKVVATVAEVFPYPYIHLGGDECPTTRWETHPLCLKRIKDEHLESVHDLQPWLVNHLGKLLQQRYGKSIVCWDELLTHWKPTYEVQPVIMAYRSLDHVRGAAEKGFKSIAVPTFPFYFDLLQVAPEATEIDAPYIGGYGDGCVNSLDKVYACQPMGVLAPRQRSFLLGMQGNLWTESCSRLVEAEYQLYPRLMALSEVAWLPAAQKDFLSFYRRLQNNVAILDAQQVRYARHFIADTVTTPQQRLVQQVAAAIEAHQTHLGQVGYPESAALPPLQSAFSAYRQQPMATAAYSHLEEAWHRYLQAPLCRPQAGQVYRLINAATYYRKRFDGSTAFVADDQMQLHYFRQIEPEELFEWVPTDKGFRLRALLTGKYLSAEQPGTVQWQQDGGTPLQIRRPTQATPPYTYLPGVVNLWAPQGVLTVGYAGTVSVGDVADAALCMPGTWRIACVTNFRTQLEGLVDKAARILEKTPLNQPGSPTMAALDSLRQEVVVAGGKALTADSISAEQYKKIVAHYRRFLTAKRLSWAQTLREDHYYYIVNAYFTDQYAGVDAGKVVTRPLQATDDRLKWRIVKHPSGKVMLVNKATRKPVAVVADRLDAPLVMGNPYHWTLAEVMTDVGRKGIAIQDHTKTFSWYANPSAFPHVLLKPTDWGASIWTFRPLTTDKVVGVVSPTLSTADTSIYNLRGQRVMPPLPPGVYVARGRKWRQ